MCSVVPDANNNLADNRPNEINLHSCYGFVLISIMLSLEIKFKRKYLLMIVGSFGSAQRQGSPDVYRLGFCGLAS